MKSMFMSWPALAVMTMICLAPASLTATGQSAPDTDESDTLAPTASDAGTPEGIPKISLPDSSHNFGTAAQHQHLTHVFKVRNIGDAPLKIISARAS